MPSGCLKTRVSPHSQTDSLDPGESLKAYATLFFVIMLISVCFIDNNIQPGIAKVGRISLALSGALFLITGAIALFT